MNQWKVEEFFDEHPYPFNVEIFNFEGLSSMLVYADITSGEADETYLFKLTFKDWKKARHYTRILSNMLSGSLDIFRVGKDLFLRKLSF